MSLLLFPSSDPLPDAPGSATAAGSVPVDTSRFRVTGNVLLRILALFFSSRLLILAAATLSRAVLIRGPYDPDVKTLAEVFYVWDAGWYLNIVAAGYSYDPTRQSAVAFYPLYPMLIRGLTHLGFDPLVAGYLISNACLLGGCVLLWKLAVLETRSEGAADRAVLFLLFFPGSYWFSMIYTESLFLFVMLACLLAARQRRWLLAALAGYAAALTRTPGLLAGAFLAVEAVQQWWEDRRAAAAAGTRRPGLLETLAARWRTLLGVAAPALGHASYLLFLQVRFGDWRAQQKTFAAGWHVPPFQLPWRTLRENWKFLDPFFFRLTFPMIALVLTLLVLAPFALRRRWGYAALTLVLALLYISSTNFRDFTRYATTIVPIYLVLGWLTERVPVLLVPLLAFSTMLLTLLTCLLANGYHIN